MRVTSEKFGYGRGKKYYLSRKKVPVNFETATYPFYGGGGEEVGTGGFFSKDGGWMGFAQKSQNG